MKSAKDFYYSSLNILGQVQEANETAKFLLQMPEPVKKGYKLRIDVLLELLAGLEASVNDQHNALAKNYITELELMNGTISEND